MEDCQANFVISMAGLENELPEDTPKLIIEADGKCELPTQSSKPGSKKVSSKQLCYAYYTSGSTGKPKGVLVEHRNVVNQLYHFQEQFGLKPGDAVMAVTTLTFDPCICEIYWPLAFGLLPLCHSFDSTM